MSSPNLESFPNELSKFEAHLEKSLGETIQRTYLGTNNISMLDSLGNLVPNVQAEMSQS